MTIQNENDRVLLSKLNDDRSGWCSISNPRWGYTEKAADAILHNAANAYAQYENCGVIYRMIRFQDIEKYGFNTSDIITFPRRTDENS